MYKVLFVCLGNICRSPMAAALFAHKLIELKCTIPFEIDSAGTINMHAGKPADWRVLQLLAEKNIPINHQARQVSLADFKYYDYIFALDVSNYESLHKIAPLTHYSAKIIQLRKYDPYSQGSLTVPDPYYGDIKDFQIVYNILGDTIENIISRFMQEKEIS